MAAPEVAPNSGIDVDKAYRDIETDVAPTPDQLRASVKGATLHGLNELLKKVDTGTKAKEHVKKQEVRGVILEAAKAARDAEKARRPELRMEAPAAAPNTQQTPEQAKQIEERMAALRRNVDATLAKDYEHLYAFFPELKEAETAPSAAPTGVSAGIENVWNKVKHGVQDLLKLKTWQMWLDKGIDKAVDLWNTVTNWLKDTVAPIMMKFKMKVPDFMKPTPKDIRLFEEKLKKFVSKDTKLTKNEEEGGEADDKKNLGEIETLLAEWQKQNPGKTPQEFFKQMTDTARTNSGETTEKKEFYTKELLIAVKSFVKISTPTPPPAAAPAAPAAPAAAPAAPAPGAPPAAAAPKP